MIIAQLSDFHARPDGRPAYGFIDTNAAIGRAVDAVLAMRPPPDCVLVTGDLSDSGFAEEYAIVRDALARLPMPVYVVPGNHDDRETFVSALSSRHGYLPATGFLNYVIEDFPIRLIGLDTLVAGESGGALSDESETWLAERLAEGNGRPTLIFMHHPPFRVAVDAMDDILCRVSPAFAGLIARHPEIERIVCGHYHRPIQRRFAGTIGYVAPGTAHQVALDLRRGTANRMIMEPPAFAVHAWDPETGLVSHLQTIGDYGAPRPFAQEPATASRTAAAAS